MNNMLTEPNYTAQQVVSRVQERLTPYQPANALLQVLPEAVHKEGRWWYVVVSPSSGLPPVSDYNTRMEKVERDLQKRDNLSVTILPDVPDWMGTLE